MARLNATEFDIENFRRDVLPKLQGNDLELAKRLLESSELGIRSFNSVNAMRPLVAAVWRGMCERNDPDRFAVGAMINEIDSFISFWVVPDEKTSGKE
jgi:hypothetical protein